MWQCVNQEKTQPLGTRYFPKWWWCWLKKASLSFLSHSWVAPEGFCKRSTGGEAEKCGKRRRYSTLVQGVPVSLSESSSHGLCNVEKNQRPERKFSMTSFTEEIRNKVSYLNLVTYKITSRNTDEGTYFFHLCDPKHISMVVHPDWQVSSIPFMERVIACGYAVYLIHYSFPSSNLPKIGLTLNKAKYN